MFKDLLLRRIELLWDAVELFSGRVLTGGSRSLGLIGSVKDTAGSLVPDILCFWSTNK